MSNEKANFLEQLKSGIKRNTFIRLKFGKYKGGDPEFETSVVTRIKTKEGERLSFNFKYRTKDIVKNYEFEKGIKLTDEILGKDFFSATLFTSEKDYTIDYSKKRIPILHAKKPSLQQAEIKQHNIEKSRFINSSAAYLNLLGITSREGNVKADKYDKFRQLDKFIEILDSLVRSASVAAKDKVKIIDMGSGKSYLSFAMYDYFANSLKKHTDVLGIEQREDLVKVSNDAARKCGYDGLKFVKREIDKFKFEKTDIAVALHACDIATDDAIKSAVDADAEIIILAPCCQKYLRKQMRIPDELKGIFKYGIHEERLAVMLTDGLRAMMLEYFGYSAKVFEFISTEHTARNTMITAVKKSKLDIKSIVKKQEIEAIKSKFGISNFYLDKIMIL